MHQSNLTVILAELTGATMKTFISAKLAGRVLALLVVGNSTGGGVGGDGGSEEVDRRKSGGYPC